MDKISREIKNISMLQKNIALERQKCAKKICLSKNLLIKTRQMQIAKNRIIELKRRVRVAQIFRKVMRSPGISIPSLRGIKLTPVERILLMRLIIRKRTILENIFARQRKIDFEGRVAPQKSNQKIEITQQKSNLDLDKDANSRQRFYEKDDKSSGDGDADLDEKINLYIEKFRSYQKVYKKNDESKDDA